MTTKTVAATGARPAFLDGRPKRMLIDGKWVDAASGKTFESINPATGEVLAQVAEGDARGHRPRRRRGPPRVRRARGASSKPFERQQLLLQARRPRRAALRRARARSTPLDMGAPISRTRGGRRRVLGHAALLRRHGDGDPRRDDRELAAGRVSSPTRSRSRSASSAPSFRGTGRWPRRCGRSARRSRRAAPSCSSRRRRRRSRRCASASCAWKRACRPASSTSCRATARPPARRWPRTRTSTRSPSPART